MDRTFEPTFLSEAAAGDALADVPIEKPSGEVYELVDQFAAVVRARFAEGAACLHGRRRPLVRRDVPESGGVDRVRRPVSLSRA